MLRYQKSQGNHGSNHGTFAMFLNKLILKINKRLLKNIDISKKGISTQELDETQYDSVIALIAFYLEQDSLDDSFSLIMGNFEETLPFTIFERQPLQSKYSELEEESMDMSILSRSTSRQDSLFASYEVTESTAFESINLANTQNIKTFPCNSALVVLEQKQLEPLCFKLPVE
ncbi:uncharacterized protein PRCAT00004931001 [Priceomyces carsonii]|uniref:uncharacterized protein n=1 Tax=Priceomyces carsonii TaxID=28549 RepID=UPI002EDAA6FB|nr:unnamed protein product [Priceomyces carsonii]